MPEETSLKQRIRNGEIVVGIRAEVGWSQSQLEDVLARDTYHFVTLDSQHSPYNEEKLLAFCGMAAGLGMPVQFRIKHTRHAYLIGNVLDLGPWAIEVPLVEDESVVDERWTPSTIHRLANAVGEAPATTSKERAGWNTPTGGTTTAFFASRWRA